MLEELSHVLDATPGMASREDYADLWAQHETSRPLLALLLALARDPLLRATARAVVATPFGHEFARQSMKDALSDAVGDRLNDATLDNVGVKRGEGGTKIAWRPA